MREEDRVGRYVGDRDTRSAGSLFQPVVFLVVTLIVTVGAIITIDAFMATDEVTVQSGTTLVAATPVSELPADRPTTAPSSPAGDVPPGHTTTSERSPGASAAQTKTKTKTQTQEQADGTAADRVAALAVDRSQPLCAQVSCVALTFDDGPDPQYTEQVLDILQAKDVTATFFLEGRYVDEFPQIAQRIAAEGHEIGHHSWSHPQFSKISSAETERQVTDTLDVMETALGLKPALMRPPYGESTAQLRRVVKQNSMSQFMWTVDTLDWKHKNPEESLRLVKRDTAKNGVILMHDVYPSTVAAVSDVVDWLHEQDYVLVNASDLAQVRDVSRLGR